MVSISLDLVHLQQGVVLPLHRLAVGNGPRMHPAATVNFPNSSITTRNLDAT